MKKIAKSLGLPIILLLCGIVLVACGGGNGGAKTQVTFTGLTANGVSGEQTTTEITINATGDNYSVFLTDITVIGATKVNLINGILHISDITVTNGEQITISLSREGFEFTPASRTVTVYVQAPIEQRAKAFAQSYIQSDNWLVSAINPADPSERFIAELNGNVFAITNYVNYPEIYEQSIWVMDNGKASQYNYVSMQYEFHSLIDNITNVWDIDQSFSFTIGLLYLIATDDPLLETLYTNNPNWLNLISISGDTMTFMGISYTIGGSTLWNETPAFEGGSYDDGYGNSPDNTFIFNDNGTMSWTNDGGSTFNGTYSLNGREITINLPGGLILKGIFSPGFHAVTLLSTDGVSFGPIMISKTL